MAMRKRQAVAFVVGTGDVAVDENRRRLREHGYPERVELALALEKREQDRRKEWRSRERER